MDIDGINIIAYVIVAILGAIAGEITDVLNYFLPKHKNIFSRENFEEYMQNATPKYLLMVIHILLYIGILRIYGTSDINAIKYMVLTPLIVSAFYIDYKKQIIPNRLTLTIFETGMIFTFLQGSKMAFELLQGTSNLNIAIRMFHDTVSMFQGMLIGVIMFLILTILGGIVFGKETMGFGDVKMMGALGLYLGFQGIIAVAILAFLIAAVFSIFLLIRQKIAHKELVEYIAFGPFIVIAAFLVIFVPINNLMVLPFIIFSFGKFGV